MSFRALHDYVAINEQILAFRAEFWDTFMKQYMLAFIHLRVITSEKNTEHETMQKKKKQV